MEEFLEEAENLSVEQLPRSGSSMSVRTDASGPGVSPSHSLSFGTPYVLDMSANRSISVVACYISQFYIKSIPS